ncbi:MULTISPECIES: D-alanyl-D-alanine carboxypeptidase family protein [Gracilibacillus]|uniref:D-alanyl-D-alanine carboxypeptidase family protein n=1 Tax=Gracilibacillus TaxID=74385 RepID=UPI000824E88D|nr:MULTISPECIES: D-alanyl-D-alanine carboxypeptidase family protein [Gracilibacillus]
MKKRLMWLILLIVVICSVFFIAFDFKQTLTGSMAPGSSTSVLSHSLPENIMDRFWLIDEVDLEAESALLIEADTGHVLYEHNSELSVPTASMSKMMSEVLVLEAIEAGALDWDDTVKLSEYALAISNHPGYASVGLSDDQAYTVRELFEAMAVSSANGATIALAEAVSGTEQAFVQEMNLKAAELGLEDSSFVNSTGLDNYLLGDYYSTGNLNDTNKMSARDLASLASYLLDTHPAVSQVMSQPQYSKGNLTSPNTNQMLSGELAYDGVDGLKTGYTDIAGYCFTGTVERDGVRLISVVTGTSSEEQRFIDTASLYEQAYDLIDNW